MKKANAGIVAIVGRANVGKSSLFNALVGKREVITAQEPGTTRDSITGKVSFAGKDFWLVDTAGLKPAEDDFELSIQDQISQSAGSADVTIVVAEAETQISAEDRQVATLALKTGRPVVLAVNKVDPGRQVDLSSWQALGIKQVVAVSALHRLGLDELLDMVSLYLPKKVIKTDPSRIKLAILGRPNAGKSSLFNALATKQQAIVSDRAGTTRDINRLVVRFNSREIELLDTAGIRRSGKIGRGVEYFSVVRALAAIEEADICLLLIDPTEPAVKLDQKIGGMIKDAGKGLIIVANKLDLAREAGIDRAEVTKRIVAAYDFAPWAPLVFTSAQTGENVAKIFDLALIVGQNRLAKFKTPQLNRWLAQASSHHPPAGHKGLHPNLSYISQEADQPLPSFKVFGSHLKVLHWSYRRYLEKSFRQEWPLAGTPIKFWFINKESSVK